MMSQIKSGKLWDWLHIQKGKDEKSPLAKNINIIEERSDDVTKTKFVKFWDWLAYQEQDEKCPLSKNQPVGANC